MAWRSEQAEGNQRNVIPASAFQIHVEKTWKKIKDNKELDLPSHMEDYIAYFS